MNSKDLAIGILSTTAVILLVGLLVIHSRPEQAYADVGDQHGDYAIATGRLDDRTDLLYIVDGTKTLMNVYGLNAKTGQLALTQRWVPLGDIRRRLQQSTGGRRP